MKRQRTKKRKKKPRLVLLFFFFFFLLAFSLLYYSFAVTQKFTTDETTKTNGGRRAKNERAGGLLSGRDKILDEISLGLVQNNEHLLLGTDSKYCDFEVGKPAWQSCSVANDTRAEVLIKPLQCFNKHCKKQMTREQVFTSA